MKNIILTLLLSLSTALAILNPSCIALWGSYDETGYFRSEHVLTVGSTYEFTNGSTEIVSVVVMPGQNLAVIEVGQTVTFTAQGEWLLIYSPEDRGESVTGLKLRKI